MEAAVTDAECVDSRSRQTWLTGLHTIYGCSDLAVIAYQHLTISPQAETLLRKLEKRRGCSGSGLRSPALSSSRASLQPLGRFLCPQCNHSQVISRLGVTVLPPLAKLSSPLVQRSRN